MNGRYRIVEPPVGAQAATPDDDVDDDQSVADNHGPARPKVRRHTYLSILGSLASLATGLPMALKFAALAG